MMQHYYFVFIIFGLCVSCNPHKNKYSEAISGEWQIEKLLHGDKNYSSNEAYILSFDEPGEVWIHNFNHAKKISLTANYKISDSSNAHFMDISKCNDDNINGNYNIYIDTIQDDGESYLIRLSLDSEKTYIQAKRFKLKNYMPPK